VTLLATLDQDWSDVLLEVLELCARERSSGRIVRRLQGSGDDETTPDNQHPARHKILLPLR
jgi:hypothetical protein